MLKLNYLLILPILMITTLVYSAPRIRIDHDRNDCQDGWITMDVTVIVGHQRFNFNPSCSFSFNKKFTTNAGVKCEAKAGMCSSFSPMTCPPNLLT
ncbi:MAG: hypothetical protein CME65_02935 [Halobacteriovoraceae bacterium]|nr:hypothetical protein [Halobacteriovoraceae bacterium]